MRERDRLLASASRHGIRRVRLFGSAARRTDRAGSDVDLLVDLRPDRSLLDAIGFQQDAAEILGMPVDVATSSILKPHVRRRVIREAVPL
ncbi:MAG TPA: nucleotidyltransferase family protein [Candidatus Limnocylindria bacterium]